MSRVPGWPDRPPTPPACMHACHGQVRDGGNLLTRAGLALPAVDVDTFCLNYPGPEDVVHHLRVSQERPQGTELGGGDGSHHRAGGCTCSRRGHGGGGVPSQLGTGRMELWCR